MTALGLVHLVSDRTFNLNNGDKLLLWCSGRNLSLLSNLRNVAWYKDSVHIPKNDPRLNTDASNSILLIEEVRKNDAGVYNCTVEAQAFVSKNITRLYVYGRELLFFFFALFVSYFLIISHISFY